MREPCRVWGDVLAGQGQPRSGEQIRRAIVSVDREIGRRVYEYLGRTGEFWELYDERVMDHLDIPAGRREIVESVQRVFDDRALVRLYPEAPSVLAALRDRRYRTGLISNHTDGLLRLVKHHRLEPMLDTITYS